MAIDIKAFADSIGYELKTTFWRDFTIADILSEDKDGFNIGLDAILDTYKRATKEWKDDKVYGTELCMVLNWKAWEHSENGIADNVGKLYTDLYYKLRNYILDNWSKDNVKYFLRTTD